jgi:cholera toxin transcriptional activator
MNVVPVADDRQGQQQERDHQQPDRLGCVNRVALVRRRGISLGSLDRHGAILALGSFRWNSFCGPRLFQRGFAGFVIPNAVRDLGFLLMAAKTQIPRSTRNDKVARCRFRLTENPEFAMLHYARTANGGCPRRSMADKKTISFGVFELDVTAGELRKSGVRLRLQGQPLQVLVLLLERAGEVVTREELRQSLWPSDTFVDFDHSLNTAINKVRDTLGDSASSPRYIETLSRRGYRFIAPVQRNELAAQGRDPQTRSDLPEAAIQESMRPASAVHPELEIPIPHRAVPRALFTLIQIMYLAFYLAALFRLHAVQVLADSFLQSWTANALVIVLIVTAGAGIPLRCYLISAVAFDYQRLGYSFRRLFPFLLGLDTLWALSPFFLIHKIGWGGAFAVCAALLYVPFSERSLIRMAYMRKQEPGLAE